MQLQEQHAENLTVVSLNLDADEDNPPQELQDRVLAQLKKSKLTITNVMSSASYDAVMEKYDLIGLPAALIFDQTGKLAQKFDGAVDYDNDIPAAIDKLLSNGKSDANKKSENNPADEQTGDSKPEPSTDDAAQSN